MGIIDMPCERSTECSNCEGLTFSFEVRKEISKKRMRQIWKTITNNPFLSKLHAFILQSEEYERMIQTLKSCQLINLQSMFEYGKKLDLNEAEAVVLRTSLSEYWILLKKNSKYSFKRNLKHELENIAKKEAENLKSNKRNQLDTR